MTQHMFAQRASKADLEKRATDLTLRRVFAMIAVAGLAIGLRRRSEMRRAFATRP